MRSAKIKLSLATKLPTRPHRWSNPVVPGDHPDPTIIRVGSTFWASATSGEWSPQFPLFRSTDLVDWEPCGAIFPVQPAWAEGSFWAPELVYDEITDRYLAWYVGRRRGGPLCIAVASAAAALGPYVDHGPLICEDDGSIDPCFARDEQGQPFLIWKEDGNSQGRPTPIWAQRLTDDLLHLTGAKTQLIINDQPWEGGIVEGPYIFRHEGRFYLFYAGNSCCGRECKYAEGVARADRLLGPWEKFAGNPLIGANDRWRCPGHGTAVHTVNAAGGTPEDYLLYHAYPAEETIYVGREAVLDRITWTALEADGRPGWPVVNAGRGPGEPDPAEPINFVDDFEGPGLGPSWQWPVNTYPEVTSGGGTLLLGIPLSSPMSARPVESAMVAVPRPASMRFRASVRLTVSVAAEPALWAGLAMVGDPFNTIGLGLRGRADGSRHVLSLWQRRGDTQAVIWQAEVATAPVVYLQSLSVSRDHLQFSFSVDGQVWQEAGEPYDASDLPAWDRGLRIALMMEGLRGLSARYAGFQLCSQ